MKEKKIDEAIEYANATNKIEDMNMTSDELKDLKSAIEKDKSSKSFLYDLVTDLKKDDKGNGKNRK